MTPKHTPTPWKIGQRSTHDNTIAITSTHAISESKQQEICRVSPAPFYDDNQETNAAFIVRAANCHDELVKALNALLRCPDLTLENLERETLDAINEAKQALAKAKGEE